MSVQDTQAERDRRLRLDLKRRLRLEGYEGDLTAIGDVMVLRALLAIQVPYEAGQRVEARPGEEWLRGTFTGYVSARPDESFLRLDIDLEGQNIAHDLPPERVRPLAPVRRES